MVSIDQQGPIWPVKRILALIFFILIAFIPWENVLSVEFNSDQFQRITGDAGLVALMILLFTLMISLLRYNKWYSGLAILVIPCVLLLIAFVFLLTLVSPKAYW